MTQPLQTFTITAPGFMGLNTQDSSLDLSTNFALIANNCVIDQYGRVGARKGWTPHHSFNAALGTAPIKMIAELIDAAGNSFTVCAGNNKFFKLVGTTLTELTFNGVGVTPTITNDNWSAAFLDGAIYFFQLGHTPLGFDPSVSTTTYYRLDSESGYNGTVQQANIAIAAYGRMWNASTATNKQILQWSDLKNPHKWGTGTAGSLDVSTVWPKGEDVITALAFHNNFLFIFGQRNILVYQGANNPATMTLADTIVGIGCIARDSVVNTGTDVIFLSETGVRSVLRTVQEKSAPIRDLSKNVRNDLLTAVSGEDKTTIKAVYNQVEGFYLLTLPLVKQVYCFDFKATLQDGSARVTTWDAIEPTAFCYRTDGTMLIGKAGYVGKYDSYMDNGINYRMQYFTSYTDFGEPSVTSILKKISVVVIGGAGQTLTTKWAYDFTGNYYASNAIIPALGVALFGVSEYNVNTSVYSQGVAVGTVVAYPNGGGKAAQVGFEAQVNGSPLSIQKVELQAKNGKRV